MKWLTLFPNGAFPILLLILPACLGSATTYSTGKMSYAILQWFKKYAFTFSIVAPPAYIATRIGQKVNKKKRNIFACKSI
jgi:hypothetical protein